MGDMCAHGGSIVVGCPTVLIGEVSPDGMNKMSPVVNAFMLNLKGFKGGEAGALAVRQNLTLQEAAADGTPFCEVCEQARTDAENEHSESTKEEEEEKNPRITNLVWMKGDQIITSSKAGKGVKIRAQVMDMDDGEELTFSINDPNVIGDDVEPIELKGKVKDGYVEVDWEVEDPYTEEEEL
jgi:hypothetical protein